MTRTGRNGRLIALALLMATLAVALVARSSPSRGEALAYTSCTVRGPRLVMDVSRIAPEDTLPVRLHEEVHVAQCRELGWAAMHWRNLRAAGRLTLEAPGYCAGARARLRRGDDYRTTRERLFDDANAMFAGSLDSAKVNAALRAECPDVTASVVQKGSA